MTDRLTVALAQINAVVGDVAGNLAKLRAARAQARAAGADLVLPPELAVVGYPPEDLVLKPSLQRAAAAAVETLARETADGGPAILATAPLVVDGALRNAVALLDGGAVRAVRVKHELPNYGVFDEKRVFLPGPPPDVMTFRGVRLGVMICEDMWFPTVAGHLARAGAEMLLVPNGSPFERRKDGVRVDLARARVAETGLPLVYVNQVGGQDELVFDGASFALGADGALVARLPAFAEALGTVAWTRGPTGWRGEAAAPAPPPADLEGVYLAMMTGLRDYVDKNRFPGIVLGMSGGVDSALSAAIAVDALGPERVRCVMMPSRFTSRDSLDDAAGCAERLGARLDTLAIGPIVDAFSGVLGPLFAGKAPDITEENLQSRIRGVLLMAISNKFGPMVLTTGNKSEMSVGYATLYGDMCGGYSVIKDVYKGVVYALCDWRNRTVPTGGRGPGGVVIPERILTKAPTAELRENQTDQDSLPPYDVLDAILTGLVEEERSVEEIAGDGFDPATVKRVEHLLHLAEYKRRQAPPGVKISRRNFGRDRRYPITNRWRDRS
ncbi:MAG: NAD+ synthase [Rhodospirillales bacterium]|jgi:NAD+ synthase